MSVIIGSARIDEHGNAHGGAAGDQKQTGTPDYRGEVSMQEFYVSSKGWYIFRAKKQTHRKKLAKAMKQACNNKNIGYDQYQRDGIIKNHTDSKVKTECDCSSLVRECIIEATGKDPGNIRTVSMPDMLPKTGLFEPTMVYTTGKMLYTGDILCTKVSGHTVIVVAGQENTGSVALPTLRKGDKDTDKGGTKGIEVSKLQKNLNKLGIKDDDGKKLAVDGEFGPKTEAAVRRFQKVYKLEIDGIYGPKSYAAMDNAIA